MHSETIKQAREFWGNVAQQNGWSMDNRGVTVWVDSDGTTLDSLYGPIDEPMNYVICDRTEEILFQEPVKL